MAIQRFGDGGCDGQVGCEQRFDQRQIDDFQAVCI